MIAAELSLLGAGPFPSEDALMKSLYLKIRRLEKTVLTDMDDKSTRLGYNLW
jgi:hypothetical protein